MMWGFPDCLGDPRAVPTASMAMGTMEDAATGEEGLPAEPDAAAGRGGRWLAIAMESRRRQVQCGSG